MANLNLALTESKSLRDDKLSEVSNEKALEALNKAKVLVFALWKGESVATTAQVAEFYEVPEDTVRKVIARHRDEFDSDGLKSVSRKASEFCEVMSLNSEGGKVVAWNPRCALRLGMLLRDSEVAKSVRTVILDCLEVIPQQTETIRELELRLQLANAEKDSAIAQKNLLDTRHYITTALPEPLQQKILGYELVEKVEYRDRIIYQNQVINDGTKINKTSLCRRYVTRKEYAELMLALS